MLRHQIITYGVMIQTCLLCIVCTAQLRVKFFVVGKCKSLQGPNFFLFFHLSTSAIVRHSCKFYFGVFLLSVHGFRIFQSPFSPFFHFMSPLFISLAKPTLVARQRLMALRACQKEKGCTVSPKQWIFPIIHLLPSFLLCFALHLLPNKTHPSPSFLRGNLMVLGEGGDSSKSPLGHTKRAGFEFTGSQSPTKPGLLNGVCSCLVFCD